MDGKGLSEQGSKYLEELKERTSEFDVDEQNIILGRFLVDVLRRRYDTFMRLGEERDIYGRRFEELMEILRTIQPTEKKDSC